MKKSLLAVAVAALAAASCATMGFGKVELGADPMVDNVREWTRSAKLYRQFNTTVLVDVTYNSLRLRGQMVESLAKARRMNADQVAELIAAQQAEHDKYAQFYLAMYTPDSSGGALTKKDPSWIVFVETEKGPVFAENLVKIQPEEIPWGASLPYDPRFRDFYRINIPRKAAKEGPVRLVLSSLMGEVRATWDNP